MRKTKTFSCSAKKNRIYYKTLGFFFFLSIATASSTPITAHDIALCIVSAPTPDIDEIPGGEPSASTTGTPEITTGEATTQISNNENIVTEGSNTQISDDGNIAIEWPNAQIADGGAVVYIPEDPNAQISDEGTPQNVPPTAFIDAINPVTARPGEPVFFQGHGEDQAGQVVEWTWSSNIDHFLNGNASFNSTLLSSGQHVISFSVKDNAGASSPIVTATVTINNPPTAYVGDEGYFGYINSSVSFDGSHSSDTDGVIISWVWNLGDGRTGTGVKPTHTYTRAGTYTVTLVVTDDFGSTDSVTTTAIIVGTSPVAHAGGPYYGFTNQTVELNGSKSSDLDGPILSWSWNFGDGTQGIGKIVRHVYQRSGVFTVSLKVTDSQGCTGSDTSFAIITPSNYPPTQPRLNVTDASEGNISVSFTVVSSDPDQDDVYYHINWGDNTTTTTPMFPSGIIISVTHTWDTPGTYTVHAVAIDEYNATSDATELVVIVNTPPPSTGSSAGTSLSPLEPRSVLPQRLLIVSGGVILLFFIALLIRFKKKKQLRNQNQLLGIELEE